MLHMKLKLSILVFTLIKNTEIIHKLRYFVDLHTLKQLY